LKTYYELLGVAPDVSADEIKRAFRKEIARYHPDKVQHLGHEFQEIAATRAAELTEAYRILMDEAERRRYDESLREGGATSPAPAAPQEVRPEPAPARPDPAPAGAPTATAAPSSERRAREQATAATTDFVKKAALARLREAAVEVAAASEGSTVRGLDASFALKSKGSLFRRADPPVRLLAKFVPRVDAQAIEDVWPVALTAGATGETVCVLLLGGGELPPSRDLSMAIADQRRKARRTGPVLVPVDVRVWEALFPPEAPASVRAILQRLREGKA
jgi:hypothetical protein